MDDERNTTCSPNSSDEDGWMCGERTRIYLERPDDMLDPYAINPSFGPIVFTHAFVFVFGVIGNSIVISTWAGSKPTRSPTCTFLVSLAVADLLLLVIYVPLETLGYFVITWDSGGTICKLSSYFEMLSGMASVLNLTAVSFERFLVIAFPLLARRYCTVSTCRKGLILVWALALILAVPVLVTKRVYPVTYYNNSTSITAFYCWDANNTIELTVAIYQLVAMFALPALLMSICYFWVIRELWSSTKAVAAMTGPNGNSIENSTCVVKFSTKFASNRQERAARNRVGNIHRQGQEIQKARKQVIKMLILVIILFLVCWGPRLIMHVAIKHGLNNYSYHVYNIRVSVYILSFVHSALNPIVYGFMSSNFRRLMLQSCPVDMARTLTCGCTKKGSAPKRNLSDTYEFSTFTTSVRRSRLANSVEVDKTVEMKNSKFVPQWTSV